MSTDQDAGHHPVYGRPTLGELVAAVRESLADTATGNGPALAGFGARVAANALAMVERELVRGHADQRAYAAALARLGAVDEAALAAEIRAGRRDRQLGEIAREFRAVVAARLAVAHPGYDTPAGQRERNSLARRPCRGAAGCPAHHWPAGTAALT